MKDSIGGHPGEVRWTVTPSEGKDSDSCGNQYWPMCSSIFAWRAPIPDREA